MLQTFLILREHPAPPANATVTHDEDSEVKPVAERYIDPVELFTAAGYRIILQEIKEETHINVRNIDAIILHLPFSALARFTHLQSLPTIWWCEDEPVLHNCNIATEIDVILSPGLTVNELHWYVSLASKNYLRRTQWKQEREQLLAKLEDRKWIDRAKSILSEIKHISEAEAYEFLRKQAMNERRRLVDVAVSIVKVYSLLKEQNPRGRTK
ncbi:ANTAR domain-containing response regulator [Paenibacillus alkalitolerans]|uniref:ANTAR domain-containing response regulator n=1 Tax=Paenibacillus alkalitolerans TaxID=2799335 RepID=UPI002D80A351|nr:ANTAR domain-containing protein [Paenibacillus alkalitolerans]